MSRVLGAVIAGGRSVRFGAPKPLAPLAGTRLVDRAVLALEASADDVVAIVNDPALAAAIGLPWRADVLPDAGSLAGIHAALLWARERDCVGVLALAADMPLVPAALLCRLRDLGTADCDAALPESDGPRGLEPLCAYYGTGCTAAIEAAVARGDARMIAFHGDVRICRLPLSETAAFGDPARLFMNINTPAEHAQVERWLAAEGS